MIALLTAAALANADVTGATLALLRITLDGPEMVAAVTDTPQHGRVLTVDCVSGCATLLHYEDPQGDLPLGYSSRSTVSRSSCRSGLAVRSITCGHTG